MYHRNLIFSIKPQIFELKCVFSYFRLKTHITLLLPVYVHSWEQRKFSDLVQIERGGSPRPIDDFITDSPDGLNWVKIGDAPAQGNYITKTAEKIKPEGLSKTREVHPGDLILSNSMSFGKPYIMGIDGCIHDGWLLIRNTYKAFDLTFLCHLLGTPQMIIQYKSLAAGSTVNNLNKELVGNTVVTIPTIKEQRVLGQYLETLDNLITLHQCKCQIDGCRFQSPLAITWEQRKFSDVVATRRGLTYKPSDIRKNGVRVLRSSNIAEDSFVLSDEDVFVVREAVNIDCVGANDILITAANGSSRLVGKHTIISGIPEESAVHGGFMLLGTTKEPHFVNASMGSSWYRRFIELFVAGGNGAIGNLNKNDLDNQDIAIPSEKEQKKIGSFFRQLDNLITLHQCE